LLPVIVITGDEDRETALKVVQRGAYDLFHKPFNIDESRSSSAARPTITRGTRQPQTCAPNSQGGLQGGIVGSSPALRRVTDQARSVAVTTATVLITGESGTGKEMLAQFITTSALAPAPHRRLQRRGAARKPGRIELFGHEKGAFTGATRAARGVLNWPTAGLFFWTRSASCRRPCR